MSRVSGCLIVRDEAGFLPEALASLRGAVDEIVVVDTGSTDGTVACAEAAGARVVSVPWTDDFSAARNAAHEVASGDWLLWLDADERLVDGAAVRRAVAAVLPDVGGLVVERHDVVVRPDSGRRDALPVGMVRLFRRDPRIRWQGRVHERPGEAIVDAGLKLGVAPEVVLRHLVAARSPELLAAKQRRYLALLDAALVADPADAWSRYYRGKTRWYLGDLAEARADFAAVSADPSARVFLRASAHVMTAAMQVASAELEEAQRSVDASLTLAPTQSLARLVGGDVAYAAGRYEDAIGQWRRVRTRLVETGGDALHGDLWLRPSAKHYKLGCALLALGRVADASVEFQAGLAADDEDAASVYGLARCAEAAGDVEAARSLLRAASRRDPGWRELRAAMGRLGDGEGGV